MIEKVLMEIQTELKAPKNQYNSFGKYAFRSCEDILEAVKPLLKEHHCALTLNDKVVMIGARYYVEATATLHHFSDDNKTETISVTASAREEDEKKGMDGSQITGASSSYARKYALNGLFAIDDNKDSDKTNKSKKGKNNAATTTDGVPVCTECGKPITASNGKSPEWIANYTEQKYGKVLCAECSKKKQVYKSKTSAAAADLGDELGGDGK